MSLPPKRTKSPGPPPARPLATPPPGPQGPLIDRGRGVPRQPYQGPPEPGSGSFLNRLAAAPAPESDRPRGSRASCSRCLDRGYYIFVEGGYAKARVCACQGACDACHGRGYLLVPDDRGYTFYRPCNCSRLRNRVDCFNRARIEDKFAFNSFENFTVDEVNKIYFDAIVSFARGYPANRVGMLLTGPTGVGKSHLMVAVLKVLTLEKGVRCLYKDFFFLITEVRKALAEGRFENEVMQPLVDVDVLVVDELGKGRSNSDWENSLLDEIVCKRYNQMKTTLFTTNYLIPENRKHPSAGASSLETSARSSDVRDSSALSRLASQGANLTSPADLETLEERLGDRIYSRILGMCNLYRISGPDRRPLNREEGNLR